MGKYHFYNSNNGGLKGIKENYMILLLLKQKQKNLILFYNKNLKIMELIYK